MSRDRNSSNGANILWFIAGLSAGTAVGLLCAPRARCGDAAAVDGPD